MDAKSIIRDPHAAIANIWGSLDTCPERDNIDRIAVKLAQAKSAIKDAKQTKGSISSQFKKAKDNPEQLNTLKANMATISAELAGLEEQRRILEAELLAYFKRQDNSNQLFPPRFEFRHRRQDRSSRITVTQVSDEDRAAWNAYVEAHDGGCLYQLYAWRRVIERSFGHHCYYYAAKTPDGNIVGVLPIIEMKSRLFGHYA
ncbi:MAG: hypothetical protein WDZ30_13035, partial [Cellvibrionaceae bacterium]